MTPEHPIEDLQNSNLVGIDNREDTLEDLEDFPPVPTYMTLPNGTTLPVVIRHVVAKQLEKELKIVGKTNNQEKNKKKKKTPMEAMVESAKKVNAFFKIYNISIVIDDAQEAFNRIATWIDIKLSKGHAEAMRYEAQCKRDDSVHSSKEWCFATIVDSVDTTSDDKDLLNVNIHAIIVHIDEDLEDFLLTPKWDNAVTAYCEDSVAAESLRDGIVKDFKFFIAKKYKKALARRYETLMSRKEEEVDSPPKIAALRDAIEESLRLHLTGLLDIEEQHEEDLSTIAEAEKAERPQKQLLGIASDVGGLFLKSSE